jgi:SAM-dependent methyltransferase
MRFRQDDQTTTGGGSVDTPSVTLSQRLDVTGWPGRERRRPALSNRHYLSLSALARDLGAALERHFPERRDLRVLDIGCGEKPYLPLVAHRAVSYRGLDAVPGPQVDDVGGAESLPYDDSSFDLLLCTQALEHLDDPATAVREMGRVLAPGGVALASTHGVHVYHPDPAGSGRDYWRWTHSGLRKLFSDNGEWNSIEVHPSGNVLTCLAGLVCWYLAPLGSRPVVGRAIGPLVAAVNWAAERLDRRFPVNLRVPEPGSLAANYLVVASRPPASSSE